MDAKDAKIELLQNLVARLQNELARFITPAEIDQAAVDQAGVDLGVLSWQTSTEHMSPLLTAYDRRIEELEAKLADRGREREGDRAVIEQLNAKNENCLLYTSPSPRDGLLSRMPSSA